jgi:hypothetical protein
MDRIPTSVRIDLIKRAEIGEERTMERGEIVEKKTNKECPVCLEEVGDLETLYCKKGCGKKFHDNCIRSWIRVMVRQDMRPSCPMCRSFWKE